MRAIGSALPERDDFTLNHDRCPLHLAPRSASQATSLLLRCSAASEDFPSTRRSRRRRWAVLRTWEEKVGAFAISFLPRASGGGGSHGREVRARRRGQASKDSGDGFGCHEIPMLRAFGVGNAVHVPVNRPVDAPGVTFRFGARWLLRRIENLQNQTCGAGTPAWLDSSHANKGEPCHQTLARHAEGETP